MIVFIFYTLFSPLIFILILISSTFNSKIRRHLLCVSKSVKYAKIKINEQKKHKEIILFHAASSGEFEQLKPILSKVNREKYFILLTFFSPTIFEKEKQNSLVDIVCYHPFDLPWSAFLFFFKIKPKKYIITRHDIWPFHLVIAKFLSIETIFINANLYDNSFRFKRGLKSFNRLLFNQFDLILTGSENLKNIIKKLSPDSNVVITGDSRFDQVIERSLKSDNNLIPKSFENSKNIILGSIVNSDLEVISKALKQLGNSFFNKRLQLIIVPHEVQEKDLSPIENLLIKKRLHYQRLSNYDEINHAPVLIIDKVGILPDLYKYAKIAYVGAGFSTGVHSVIEPAVHKCAVIYGPYFDILDEAIEMAENKSGTVVNNGNELGLFFKKISNIKEIEILGERAYKYVINKQNASERILNEIFV